VVDLPRSWPKRPTSATIAAGGGGRGLVEYLDYERFEAIDPRAYRAQKPYPWSNPEGLLKPEAFRVLRSSLPELSLLEPFFGKARKSGQEPHDRYMLEYKEGAPVPEPWRKFIEELKGERYRRLLCRLFDVRAISINFHWHYTPSGCSVSPHCDSRRKLGSHIFYFNTEEDWDPGWGGQTVVLDDGGRFPPDSAPRFEDFDAEISSVAVGNYSFLFTRRGNSWHGVREIRCPEDRMRRVFIVVVNDHRPWARFRNWISSKDIERY
jgi:hypothetical protein